MKVFVVSDFNAELVSRYLVADKSTPECDVATAPFGQVFQSLAADPPGGSGTSAFVWTRPESVVPEYAKIIAGDPVDLERLNAEVDTFAATVKTFAAKCRLVLIGSWVSSRGGRGLGMLDWSRHGVAATLARMNIRLADKLSAAAGVFVLDGQRWLDGAHPARDAKFWHAMKSPFTEGVCQAAARDLKAALRAAEGLTRKLIVVDLDDTLWGGIVGDDGIDALRLGGHDAVGEAFVEFQRALKSLSRRGIAIAVVSKNDEAVALEAIDKHPEMVLRRADLSAWRINWNDKAQNVAELTRELNLGLQSIVFIDDNPAERGRVREALPDVLVPEWPKDPARFAETLLGLDCFDQAAITDEDRARTKMYVQERERGSSVSVANSMEDWLNSLDVRVIIEPVGPKNLKRAVQLLNKTNQLNLRTRRLTETEMTRWVEAAQGRQAMTVTVSDRFGDVGLTGVVSWELAGDALEIVDYVLSCRAMGRHIERLMAALAVEAGQAAGLQSVVARLIPTPRNRPCLDFWRESRFEEAEPNVFIWDLKKPYSRPDFIVTMPPVAVTAAQ